VARKKSITKRRRVLFLDRLRVTGSVTKAAIHGEIGRGSWYELAERDADFKALWDDAETGFLDDCEAEALRRAIAGENEDKPYTSLKANGDKVTAFRTVNTKSDRLLELVLKSRHPNYKQTKALEITSPDGSMTPKPHVGALDYSGFSDDELVTFTELLRKAHDRAAAA
jgi:hypothetical protein